MIYISPHSQEQKTLDPFFDQLLPKISEALREVDWRTERLRKFIDDQPTRVHGNLDGICKQLELSMSDRQIRRLFIKDSAGVGIRNYAKNRRLVIAAGQLKVIDIPVKVIAADAGYRSSCHFARGFKKLFLFSPMEFRRIWNKKPRSAPTQSKSTDLRKRFPEVHRWNELLV